MIKLGNDWDDFLENEIKKDYYVKLREFLKQEYAQKTIFPDQYDIFNALKYAPLKDTSVVILGQDPYINPGEAHGLAFSVKPGASVPPSLRNIFKELAEDMGTYIPNNGYLVKWAVQGVMMLNAVLTVERGKSRSHAGMGWETFTSAVIGEINKKREPVVFLLWGRDAQAKAGLIDNNNHLILTAAHPSPLAGGRFFGCKHFSKANAFLTANGRNPVDWQIENV